MTRVAGRPGGSATRVAPVAGRLGRSIATPFGLAMLGCLILAGWALWTAGLLDGPAAREVRGSSVYAAPEVELDRPAAERIIGNRRLVVVLLAPGADLREGCDSVRRAAAGTLVLLLSPDGDGGYDRYGCSLLRAGDDDFGRALVAETLIARGTDPFGDRPLAALKVVAVNYDLLVKAGTIPDGARTVSPSLPRYLLAAAAVVAVVAGTAVAYAADRRSQLRAATAVVAQQILDLDQRLDLDQHLGQRAGGGAAGRYRQLAAEYARLLDPVTAMDRHDEAELTRLTAQVETLGERCRRFAETLTEPLVRP